MPDDDNDRLVIYNQSGGTCGAGATSLHVFEIPLDDPGSPTTPTPIPLIGAAANVYDIGENQFAGGSLTNPVPLYRVSEPGVGVAAEVAYADPAPLVPTQLGGDWSTYYYNGRIYESDITRGLIIWSLSGKWDAGARKLDHLNPQTSEFTIG